MVPIATFAAHECGFADAPMGLHRPVPPVVSVRRTRRRAPPRLNCTPEIPEVMTPWPLPNPTPRLKP